MKIETKFNVGQKVWFMQNNKTRFNDVAKIFIECGYPSYRHKEKYLLSHTGNDAFVDPDILFASKQDLLDSL